MYGAASCSGWEERRESRIHEKELIESGYGLSD
jgi:hypothetical protein